MSEHEGHRKRLLERLAEGNLCDHEYLETLLFYAIPRKDTHPIAHELLSRFGNVRNVLYAPKESLLEIKGIGENSAAFIRFVRELVIRGGRLAENSFPAKFEKPSFYSFLQQECGSLPYEAFDVYFIGVGNRILSRKRFPGDDPKSVQLKTSELIACIEQECPSGIVLTHNHPSGDPRPSESDEATTKKCFMVCQSREILLCDHIICGKQGVYSYYDSGRLAWISREYTLDNLTSRDPDPVTEKKTSAGGTSDFPITEVR